MSCIEQGEIFQIPLLQQFPYLANVEEIGDELLLVSSVVIPSFQGINPLIKSLFLCYLNQCALQLDFDALQKIHFVLSSCCPDIHYNPERQLVAPLIEELDKMMISIKQIQAQSITISQYQEQFAAFENHCTFQCNQQGSLEFAASLFYMKRITELKDQNCFQLNHLLMGSINFIHECQFQLICQLLQINCKVYQLKEEEISSSKVQLLFLKMSSGALSTDSRIMHSIVINEDQSCAIFGQNMTYKKITKIIQDSLFLYLEEYMILQQYTETQEQLKKGTDSMQDEYYKLQQRNQKQQETIKTLQNVNQTSKIALSHKNESVQKLMTTFTEIKKNLLELNSKLKK